MANNFAPVGSEIQVSNNGNVDDLNPDVAVMSDGRFFVAFEKDFGAGDLDIRGQFVNPDGTLAGGNAVVESEAGGEINPAVAFRPGGAAVVVWQDGDTGGAVPNIQLAIIDSTGANVTLGSELDVVAGTADDGNPTREPDVATFANGTSIIVYEVNLGGDDNIHYRILDAAGSAFVGGVQVIDNSALTTYQRPTVAAFGNQALVAFEDEANDDILARFYDATSNTVGALQTIATGNLDNPDVAALSDGRYVVVWDNEDTDDIEGRLVDAAGNPVGSVFFISNIGGTNEDPRVAALPGGGFVVTWENNGGNFATENADGNNAVVGRRFDGNGVPAGDLFLVNTGDPDSAQDNPAIAANATTGQAFIAWEDDHDFSGAGGDTNQPDIRGRAFLATADVVNGTDGSDFIQTFSLSETINGLGGDDAINGLAGDDVIHGGAGFDQIAGGAGNDQLFGEGGEDLLKGEDGDDLLVGGVGRDVQIGGTGADTFDFNAINESRVGANHDFIRQFKHSESDRIDLKTIDADTTAGGNQAFDFIGGAGFSGTAGELRLSAGLLLGDTNGNGIADFEIRVTGIGAGASGDFVL